MTFLILPPQFVRGPQFPLGFLRTQIKLQHRLRIMRLRVKAEVAGNYIPWSCPKGKGQKTLKG